MAPRYDWLIAHKEEEAESRWESDYEVTTEPTASTEFEEPDTKDEDDYDYWSHYTGMPGPRFTGAYTGSIPAPSWWSSRLSQPQPTDTLVTSPYSGSALPEQTGASGSPTAVGSDNSPLPSSSDASGFRTDPDWATKGGSNRSALYAAAGVVPVVVLAIIGAAIFFCLRKKKKQRQIAATQARVEQQMKRNNITGPNPIVSAFAQMASPPVPPRQPSYTGPPNDPPPASPTSPQPVILGPISSGANGNYMTGIDTSDAVSVTNERTGLGDPFADGNSLNEEPPPPYRPRSVAPLSRDTSLRVPHAAATSQTSLVASHEQPERSPFDDPEDDDAVSDISGPTLPRDRDNMSVVSDLSYQQDPVVGRPAV